MIDLKQISAKARRFLRRRDRYVDLFRKNPLGREVFADLCQRYHFWTSVTVRPRADGPVDPLLSAYRDGQRSVVQEIARLMNMGDDELARLIEETTDV